MLKQVRHTLWVFEPSRRERGVLVRVATASSKREIFIPVTELLRGYLQNLFWIPSWFETTMASVVQRATCILHLTVSLLFRASTTGIDMQASCVRGRTLHYSPKFQWDLLFQARLEKGHSSVGCSDYTILWGLVGWLSSIFEFGFASILLILFSHPSHWLHSNSRHQFNDKLNWPVP